MMIISKRYKVDLRKTYLKILYLSSAIQDTFVFVGISHIGRDVLVHCSANGGIIFEYPFEDNVDSMAMVSNRQVIVAETQYNRLMLLDLQTHQITHLKHPFLYSESEQTVLDAYPFTHLLCVREMGCHGDHRLRLTYYQHPITSSSQPVSVYESDDNQWTSDMVVRRGNMHSMQLWTHTRCDYQFSLRWFDLSLGKFQQLNIPNSLEGGHDHRCAILQIWQQAKGQFIAACIYTRLKVSSSESKGVIVHISSQGVRMSHINLGGDYADILINHVNLGDYCFLQTMSYSAGQSLSSPVFFIHNREETVRLKEMEVFSSEGRYWQGGVSGNRLQDGKWAKSAVKAFEWSVREIYSFKEILLNMLLTIEPDFDDDLLKDAIELLDQE